MVHATNFAQEVHFTTVLCGSGGAFQCLRNWGGVLNEEEAG